MDKKASSKELLSPVVKKTYYRMNVLTFFKLALLTLEHFAKCQNLTNSAPTQIQHPVIQRYSECYIIINLIKQKLFKIIYVLCTGVVRANPSKTLKAAETSTPANSTFRYHPLNFFHKTFPQKLPPIFTIGD